jgi:DNA-binding XRE family transcriptional regulator
MKAVAKPGRRPALSKEVSALRAEVRVLRADLDAIEDILAARVLAAAPVEESFPADVADRLVAGESPIRVFRELRGMTQEILAAAAGTSAQYLSQIERGDREAGRKMLPRLAAALKVDEDLLR